MSWGMVAVAAASVVGGAMSANAAGKAADAQSGAAADANALQKYMFDEQKRMQEPWRQAGMGGLNKLSYLMGLSPGGGAGAPTVQSPEDIRRRLVAQYTSNGTATPANPGPQPWEQQPDANVPTGAPAAPVSTINEVALQRAIEAEQKKQQAALAQYNAQAEAKAGRDPQYGSLLDKFGMDDFKADPGYQFRQQEGMKALERSSAARGGLFSGRAMKDTMRFSQGLASQEYGTAFDRFNVQNANTFNRLASISGVGQTSANQTGAAAQNYGNQASGNIIGAGNAQAAGAVGSANAWNNAIGQGTSMYQQNQMMNKLFPSGSGGGWSPSTAPSNAGSYSQPADYGQFI